MTSFIKGKEATKILGVHQQTLYQWENKGWIETIRTPGGIRLYNVNKYLYEQGLQYNPETHQTEPIQRSSMRRRICYCRVSSYKQKDDLDRQVAFMKDRFPDHDLIKDVGSGMNFKRRGFLRLMDMAIRGEVEEVVVAYKDRLARFGFEFFEHQIKKYSNGKIVIINDDDDSIEEEFSKDLLQIMNVFVAKMNGLRRYKQSKSP